jgi:hypothetical protein
LRGGVEERRKVADQIADAGSQPNLEPPALTKSNPVMFD